MAQICEITRKRIPHAGNLAEGQKPEKLFKRNLEIKEIKDKVRLRVSNAGLEIIKKAGGLAKFVSQQPEEQLKKNPKLKKIFDRLPESMKPKKEEPSSEAPAEEKKE